MTLDLNRLDLSGPGQNDAGRRAVALIVASVRGDTALSTGLLADIGSDPRDWILTLFALTTLGAGLLRDAHPTPDEQEQRCQELLHRFAAMEED